MIVTVEILCTTPAFGSSPASAARELRTALNRPDPLILEAAILGAVNNGKAVFPLTDRNNRPVGTLKVTL